MEIYRKIRPAGGSGNSLAIPLTKDINKFMGWERGTEIVIQITETPDKELIIKTREE